MSFTIIDVSLILLWCVVGIGGKPQAGFTKTYCLSCRSCTEANNLAQIDCNKVVEVQQGATVSLYCWHNHHESNTKQNRRLQLEWQYTRNNFTKDIIIENLNRSLTIRGVQPHHAGRYSCSLLVLDDYIWMPRIHERKGLPLPRASFQVKVLNATHSKPDGMTWIQSAAYFYRGKEFKDNIKYDAVTVVSQKFHHGPKTEIIRFKWIITKPYKRVGDDVTFKCLPDLAVTITGIEICWERVLNGSRNSVGLQRSLTPQPYQKLFTYNPQYQSWTRHISDSRFSVYPWHMTITGVSKEDTDLYRCILHWKNEDPFYKETGKYKYLQYYLTVTDKSPVEPRVQIGPGLMENVTVVEGSNVTLKCIINSNFVAPVYMKWLFFSKATYDILGKIIKPENFYQTPTLSVSSAEPLYHHIYGIEQSQEGWYMCYAIYEPHMNADARWKGRHTAKAYVKVLPPFITTTVEYGTDSSSPEIVLDWWINMSIGIGVAAFFITALMFTCKFAHSCIVSSKKGKLKHISIVIKKGHIYSEEEGIVVDAITPEVTISGTTRRLSQELRSDWCDYEFPEDRKWEFPRERLTIVRNIGEGEFGTVSLATAAGINGDGEIVQVAVKSIHDHGTEQDLVDLLTEVETLKSVGHHDNIINLLGTCTQGGGPVLVITELAERGNLRDFLRANQSSRMHGKRHCAAPSYSNVMQFRLGDMAAMGTQIASGMKFLAGKGCLHRDLAARNVLITRNNILKVADFGRTRMLRNDKNYYRKAVQERVPVKWMAPESVMGGVYNAKSDVWSFGVTLWEIFTLGGQPYPNLVTWDALAEHLNAGRRLYMPDDWSYIIKELLNACWSWTPAHRPTFQEIQHILVRFIGTLPPHQREIAFTYKLDESRHTETASPDKEMTNTAPANPKPEQECTHDGYLKPLPVGGQSTGPEHHFDGKEMTNTASGDPKPEQECTCDRYFEPLPVGGQSTGPEHHFDGSGDMELECSGMTRM